LYYFHFLFYQTLNAKGDNMKRLLVYTAFVFAIISCNNGGNSDNQEASDTTSPASGATGIGPDSISGSDTTGLDVGAVQPIDSSTNSRRISDEPGADKSGVSNNGTTSGDTGRGTGGGDR
jgi:hypothetical protein